MCPLFFRRSHAFLPSVRSFVFVAKSERVKDKSYRGGGAGGQPPQAPKPPPAAAVRRFLCLFRRLLGLFAVALSAFCVRVGGSACSRAGLRRRACGAPPSVGGCSACWLVGLFWGSFVVPFDGGGCRAFLLAALCLCAF